MRKPSPLNLISLAILILWSASCGAQDASTPEMNPTSAEHTEMATPPLARPAADELSVILLRADPQRTGVFDLPAMRDQPEVYWQAHIDSTLLTAPLLADELLYTVSLTGTMYALNTETGREVWSGAGHGQLENTGAIAGDMIISGGINRQVRARDRHNGDELWTFETDYPVQGSPLIVDDRTNIATDREVYALDLMSGELIWKAKIAEEQASFLTGTPAYEDGVIYSNGGRFLVALDSQTGEELWRIEKEEPFLGLALSKEMVYVGNWDHHLYAFDRSTGEERWSHEAEGELWSAPAVTGETVYAGNKDQLYALDAQSGELLWSFQAGGEPVSEPLITDGVIYFTDGNHEVRRRSLHLYALDSITGEELWKFEMESTFLPAPALGDGVMYLSSKGEVIALK